VLPSLLPFTLILVVVARPTFSFSFFPLCLSIAFGEAQLIAAAISVFRNNEWAPQAWHVVLIFWLIMIVCAIINAWGVKANLLEPLNTASIYWTSATVIIICITVLVMSDDRRTGA
jgi:succinate-acetate transporter protein